MSIYFGSSDLGLGTWALGGHVTKNLLVYLFYQMFSYEWYQFYLTNLIDKIYYY